LDLTGLFLLPSITGVACMQTCVFFYLGSLVVKLSWLQRRAIQNKNEAFSKSIIQFTSLALVGRKGQGTQRGTHHKHTNKHTNKHTKK
jgi:hypothetical protein